ncbi:hypothetical protein [Paraburkholderia ginsengisoli]|uniref:Uncharacterized protein n=1 Tax=Paraburkholderia ginsengisoli TaxID=311231 RepID=A0A7T4MZN3_9BURK|nr:hypothetical protein [Paraburkholderia ginsengisoli]QQC62521.1 hypothetical protein I6I06_09225 [Paraburkholderia ginsengisoli]
MLAAVVAFIQISSSREILSMWARWPNIAAPDTRITGTVPALYLTGKKIEGEQQIGCSAA